MNRRSDQVAKAVTDLAPIGNDEIRIAHDAPESQALLAFILAQPFNHAAGRPQLALGARRRRSMLALAASGLVVLVLAVATLGVVAAAVTVLALAIVVVPSMIYRRRLGLYGQLFDTGVGIAGVLICLFWLFTAIFSQTVAPFDPLGQMVVMKDALPGSVVPDGGGPSTAWECFLFACSGRWATMPNAAMRKRSSCCTKKSPPASDTCATWALATSRSTGKAAH